MEMNDLLIEITEKPGFWYIANKIAGMIFLTMFCCLGAIGGLCLIEPSENVYLGVILIFLWITMLANSLKQLLEDWKILK